MKKSESIVKLAVSLAKFNGEISSISKDAKNPFFKSEYVTLDKLILATREPLQKNGLSVMQMPLSKEETGEIGVQTLLLHESGEYIESEPLFMKPIKNDPQQAGSLITYLRRYSYQAILNLNTGEDDDANSSTYIEPPKDNKAKGQENKSELSQAQIKRLYAIAKNVNITPTQIVDVIKKEFNKTDVVKLTKTEYDTICKRLESKATDK